MKRIWPFLLVLLLLAAPAAVQAQFTCTTNNGTITITGYTGPGGAMTIPSTINGLPVASIATNAFDDFTNLTSVTIPNSVTSIGENAFEGCISLTTVTIPASVTNIGEDAFFESGLTGVTFANGVTSIGDYAFNGCSSLTNITFPNSVTSIGAYAFWQAYALISVTIPASVTNVGNDIFGACYSLTNIAVDTGNPVYSSLNGVLFGQSQTTLIQYPGGIRGSYTIPASVRNIGVLAFERASLASVTIPGSVISIGEEAFYDSGLASVTIANGVTIIGDYAFAYCSLTSVTIPASITSIGSQAFWYCRSLTNVCFEGNAPVDGGDIFENAPVATIYYVNGATGWGSTYDGLPTASCQQCGAGSLQVTITPAGAITAGAQWQVDGGTWENSGATVANLSVGNHTVSFSAVSGWTTPSNQTVSVSANSTATATGVYTIIGAGETQFSFTTNSGTITITGYAGPGGALTIPSTINGYPVTTIGEEAFENCSTVTNVTIGTNVTSIGDYAFAYCALTSVTMPNSVTSIGEYAFAYSTSLTRVYFEGNAPTADSTVFANESNVTVYYLSGTTGWSSTFAGVPTVELAGIVAFSANPTNGGVPLTVSFTSAAVDSGGNAITNWNWNFGDGSTSTAQNPSHTYTAVGTFSPALIATNSAGATISGVGPSSITVTTATSNGFTVVYSYDSPTFSGVTPGCGLTSTNFVSASVTYSNVLAPNLQDASPNRSLQPDLPMSWVFSDGVEQWTPANSHFYVAQVNTDANGNIVGWNFNLYSNPGFSEPELYISSSTPTSYGSVEVDLPLSGPYQTAYVEYGPGVDIAWRRTVAPAPTGVPITAAPTNGLAPLTVNFSAASVDSAGNAITRWNWTFGDGSTSTNQNPPHTYTAVGATVGAFYPTLVATNNIGGVVMGYGPSLITASNLLVAFSANPTNGRVPLTVSFTSAAVDSAGNAITNWNWSFGDGSTGTAQNPSHTYTAGGTFSPALIATNNIGEMVTGVGLAAITAISDTILHSFTNGVDGAYPVSGLLLSGNTLYGTAGGGRAGNGTVFAIKTDGTGFTNLYSFSSTGTNGLNSDGANPSGNLILSGNTLYGTANGGGSGGSGTVFAIKTDGTGFTKLYSFTALDPTFSTNSDGAYPVAGLLLSGNTLYGTAGNGGSEGSGTVFAVTTNGTGFTNLHSFTAVDATFFTNSDGVFPFSELISSGNILYGTANRGGIGGSGTVFAIKTDGTGFTNL